MIVQSSCFLISFENSKIQLIKCLILLNFLAAEINNDQNLKKPLTKTFIFNSKMDQKNLLIKYELFDTSGLLTEILGETRNSVSCRSRQGCQDWVSTYHANLDRGSKLSGNMLREYKKRFETEYQYTWKFWTGVQNWVSTYCEGLGGVSKLGLNLPCKSWEGFKTESLHAARVQKEVWNWVLTYHENSRPGYKTGYQHTIKVLVCASGLLIYIPCMSQQGHKTKLLHAVRVSKEFQNLVSRYHGNSQ